MRRKAEAVRLRPARPDGRLSACEGRCRTAVTSTTSIVKSQDHYLAPMTLEAGAAKVTIKVRQCTLGYSADAQGRPPIRWVTG